MECLGVGMGLVGVGRETVPGVDGGAQAEGAGRKVRLV